MHRKLKVAAIQMQCEPQSTRNIDNATEWVKSAASKGANLILLPELFELPYFCKTQRAEHLALAVSVKDSALLQHFRKLAKSLAVTLPISFYERDGNARFNSIAIINNKGDIDGVYRKSHIPDGPGYQEKFYFSPGNSGFKTWQCENARFGVGICWDQWFPESARSMALLGAEILLYPTAIGSEPPAPDYDSEPHWRTVMCGHAGANIMPLIAANRIGDETSPEGQHVRFYGSSFIADWCGQIVEHAPRDQEALLFAEFDLAHIDAVRSAWGLFRDRRPDIYDPLMSL